MKFINTVKFYCISGPQDLYPGGGAGSQADSFAPSDFPAGHVATRTLRFPGEGGRAPGLTGCERLPRTFRRPLPPSAAATAQVSPPPPPRRAPTACGCVCPSTCEDAGVWRGRGGSRGHQSGSGSKGARLKVWKEEANLFSVSQSESSTSRFHL